MGRGSTIAPHRPGTNGNWLRNGSGIRIDDQGRIPRRGSIEFDFMGIDPEMISDSPYYCCPVGFVGF